MFTGPERRKESNARMRELVAGLEAQLEEMRQESADRATTQLELHDILHRLEAGIDALADSQEPATSPAETLAAMLELVVEWLPGELVPPLELLETLTPNERLDLARWAGQCLTYQTQEIPGRFPLVKLEAVG